MNRYTGSLLISAISFAFAIFIYWLGGGEFVRGSDLKEGILMSILAAGGVFFMSVSCPVWDSKNG